MHSAGYAVVSCLTVRPSVCLLHAGILSKRLHISSNFFHRRVVTPFWFFNAKRCGNNSDGDLLTLAKAEALRNDAILILLFVCLFVAYFFLTLYEHIKTAEERTIIQQYGDWYTGR